MEIKDKTLLSMREVLNRGLIPWIKSPQTLRKWIEWDKKNNNLLKPVIIITKGTTRYYFNPENVKAFVETTRNGPTI